MLSVLMDDLKEHSYCLAKSRPPQNYKAVVIDKVESVVSVCARCSKYPKLSKIILQRMKYNQRQTDL